MSAHIKSFVKTADQEELHQFRVQVKKLRALLIMIESSSKNAQLKKDFKPIKKIFKEAGEIRSAFVNLELSDQYHIKNPEFEKKQQETMDQGTKEFVARGFKLIKKLKRSQHRIYRDIHHLKNKTITKFYRHTLDEVSAFFANIQFDEDLHDCRKKIKFLLYNHKPAHKAISKKLSLDEEYLDKVQETVGKWHDNVLAIDLLSIEAHVDESLLKDFEQNDEKLRMEITDLVKDFKNKVFLPDQKQKDKAEKQYR